MRIKGIERAIAQLPENELTELMTWLENHRHEIWDKQIETDLESGRLDAILSEVEVEYQKLKLN